MSRKKWISCPGNKNWNPCKINFRSKILNFIFFFFDSNSEREFGWSDQWRPDRRLGSTLRSGLLAWRTCRSPSTNLTQQFTGSSGRLSPVTCHLVPYKVTREQWLMFLSFHLLLISVNFLRFVLWSLMHCWSWRIKVNGIFFFF